MTREEIEKFLANTKVYVSGKSKEIQEKLFSLGYKWSQGLAVVCSLDYPFLYIQEDMSFKKGSDMEYFSKHKNREISAEEILSLELTESGYRPFKNQEECWQEMLKHQPFGWIIYDETYHSICEVTPDEITIFYECDPCGIDFKTCLEKVTFADGTPFGIRED